ncbi:MAG: hypothetical protein RL657_2133 [Pseudomonadota bacterium]
MSPYNDPDEKQLLERLRIGLRHGAIQAHFQPELDDDRPDWVGFEALARWQDPVLGEVSPAVFIPLAERHDLLAELTCAQIRSLSQAAEQLCRRFSSVALAFNLSPRLIGQADIWGALLQARTATAHLPLTWEVEITESEPIDDFGQAEVQLAVLRQQGIKVVLDDFGTGWSNLVRLALLGVHRIKVDSVFVRHLENPATQAVLQGVLQLARAMSLEITIEGVETRSQEAALRQMGFRRFQGWLCAKAMPLADALNFKIPT